MRDASPNADARHVVCPRCASTNRLPFGRNAMAANCGSCGQRLFDAHPAEVDASALDRHVRSSDIPVLLDVWAPWCGPCRAMAPMFAHAAEALEPEFRLLKLNADNAPEVIARLGVQGIPALFLFHHGVVAARTTGAMDANAIVAWARQGMAETATTTPR